MEIKLGTGITATPGDTFNHPQHGKFLACANLVADRALRCEGCSRRSPAFVDSLDCFSLPNCENVVWVHDTPQGREAYALKLLES